MVVSWWRVAVLSCVVLHDILVQNNMSLMRYNCCCYDFSHDTFEQEPLSSYGKTPQTLLSSRHVNNSEKWKCKKTNKQKHKKTQKTTAQIRIITCVAGKLVLLRVDCCACTLYSVLYVWVCVVNGSLYER